MEALFDALAKASGFNSSPNLCQVALYLSLENVQVFDLSQGVGVRIFGGL